MNTSDAIKRLIVVRLALLELKVDTKVQEKDIRFPADARWYHRTRQRLVGAGKQREIHLRPNYNRNAKRLFFKQCRI